MSDKAVDHIKDVCRIGQGASTCRYLSMSANGWECLKLLPGMKAAIDRRAASMNAKGDNCDGRTMAVLNK